MTKLEELKAAYEAATPGEWAAPGFNSQGGQVACLLDNPDGLRLVSGNFKRPDAKFVALSHNLMPALLEAVEALESLTMRLEWLNDPRTFNTEQPWIDQGRKVLEKLK